MPTQIGGPAGFVGPPQKPAEGSVWTFVGGRFVPSTSVDIVGTIRSKNTAVAGIQLDGNAATGDFTLSLSPANITANRRWSFPDSTDTVAGLGQAQTFSAINRFSNTTSATTTLTGSVIFGDQSTASANVSIGNGKVFTGSDVTCGGVVYATTAILATGSNSYFDAVGSNPYFNLGGSGAASKPAGLAYGFYAKSGVGIAYVSSNNGAIDYEDQSGNVLLTLRNSQARFGITTSATTSTAGSVVIGDGATAAINVAFGAGNIVAGANISAGAAGVFKVNSNQVVGARITGYGTPTGNVNQGSFAAGSITLPNLAAGVAQLILDLKTHGLLGT